MASPKTSMQSLLLLLYRQMRQSRFIRSPTGRRLFENAYLAYKVLLEAGPVGQLQRYVTSNSCAIDVGANIGMFTLRFARWVGDHGQVIAIEPEAENFKSLRRRLARSAYAKRVTAIQAVAAEAAGILYLDVNPDHPGDHKLGERGVPTTAVTLDGFLTENGGPVVSLVKIDVQGAEMRVLRGATQILARCRPALFIEIDDAAMRKQGSTAQELLSFLTDLGYIPYELRLFGPAQAIAPSEIGVRTYQDVLFLNDRAPNNSKAP